MTSVKDQYKLLKDIGKGVTDGVKKLAEPFVKEAVGLPEAKKLLQGIRPGPLKKARKYLKAEEKNRQGIRPGPLKKARKITK